MNFSNLLQQLWVGTGYPNPAADRQNWRLQSYRDAINTVLEEVIQTNAPFLFSQQREGTINLVAGTSIYTLDDWCARPLSIYTTDVAAHKLVYVRPRRADQNGMRNPSFVYPPLGPYTFTDAMRTSTPAVSGVSGASYGLSASDGDLTVTVGSSNTSFVGNTDIIGRRLRINGEYGDYTVLSVASAHVLNIDRPIKSRCDDSTTCMNTDGAGAGYTQVKWEIGPPQRLRIQVLPTPSAAKTINYRYAVLPRRLLNGDDVPEINEEYHHLLWKGALRLVGAMKQNGDMIQQWGTEYGQALMELAKADQDDWDSDDAPKRETLMDNLERGVPPGVYSRGMIGGVTQ